MEVQTDNSNYREDVQFINMPFPTKICTKLQPIKCLECTSTVLLLADLDSMPLDYVYSSEMGF